MWLHQRLLIWRVNLSDNINFWHYMFAGIGMNARRVLLASSYFELLSFTIHFYFVNLLNGWFIRIFSAWSDAILTDFFLSFLESWSSRFNWFFSFHKKGGTAALGPLLFYRSRNLSFLGTLFVKLDRTVAMITVRGLDVGFPFTWLESSWWLVYLTTTLHARSLLT